MRCPLCNCPHVATTHTWQRSYTVRGQLIHVVERRRVCRHCGNVYRTTEKEIIKSSPKEDLEALPDDHLFRTMKEDGTG